MIRYTSELEKAKIVARDDTIGHVEDLYFEDSVWTVRYMVVDTAPLFLGRKVLISPFAVTSVVWDEKKVGVDLTAEQVKNSPDVATVMPVSRQQEIELYRFYQWPPYWSGVGLWGLGADPAAAKDLMADFDDLKKQKQYDVPSENPEGNLRSASEVEGYAIGARDGEIGEIEDFAVDDVTWTIRYFVIRTRKVFGGKHVVLGTDWVNDVDWSTKSVGMDLTQSQIEHAPEHTDSRPIDRDYEQVLAEHYGKRGYWA